MSKDLLGSDTDIFIYNTKEDDEEQSLKISLLSGKNRSLWNKSPYLRSSENDDKIDLEISNQSGDIKIESSGKIDLNGVKWPSKNESRSMILSPEIISNKDLSLCLVDNEFIQFKTPIKDPEITFTDTTPTQIDIGGIKAGSTFDNVPISEIIRQMLYPYLNPKIEIEILNVGDNDSLERDHTEESTVIVKYTLVRRSENIVSTTMSIKNSKTVLENREMDGVVSSGLSRSEFCDAFHVSPSKISTDKEDGQFTIMVKSVDTRGEIGEESKVINFVYPYFYGFLGSIDFGVDYITSQMGSLRKKIDIRCDQNLPVVGNGYFYLMVPSKYGEVSISGISTPKFEKKTVNNIYSPDKKWGSVDYDVYISKEEVLISGIPEMWKIIFL